MLELDEYYIGTGHGSDVRVFLIPNFPQFCEDNKEKSEVLYRACKAIEEDVWNIKYVQKEHKTFLKGSLILYFLGKKLCGMMSLNYFPLGRHSEGFYFTDAMFLPSIRGKGLSYLGYSILSACGYLLSKEKQKNKMIAVILSGDLALFKYFYRFPYYKEIEDHQLTVGEGERIKEHLDIDFKGRERNVQGVIKNAWNQQAKIERERWPVDQAKKLGLPSNICFESGDVFHRNYILQEKEVFKLKKYLKLQGYNIDV